MEKEIAKNRARMRDLGSYQAKPRFMNDKQAKNWWDKLVVHIITINIKSKDESDY